MHDCICNNNNNNDNNTSLIGNLHFSEPLQSQAKLKPQRTQHNQTDTFSNIDAEECQRYVAVTYVR